MGIFSRRDIQEALDALNPHLTSDQLDELVGRLNGAALSPGPRKFADVLAAEWEVAILSALGKCGHVAYAKDFGGPKRLDVFFQLDGSELEFAADVRAVSDVDAHKENPIADFHRAVARYLSKRGHSAAGLRVNVDAIEDGDYRDRKILLALPRKRELDVFVKTELGDFLSGISRNSTTDASFSFHRGGIGFSIRYSSAEKQYSTASHLSYTAPCSVQRNPVANALRRKGDQLAKSGYAGARGIILCDAGCDSLRENDGCSALGCRQIVEAFLSTRSSILWVLVIRVDESFDPLGLRKIGLKSTLYWNKDGDKSLHATTLNVHRELLSLMPQPEVTPANARQSHSASTVSRGRPLGGCRMGSHAIRISARALTEFLAGRMTKEAFLERQGLDPTGFFERQLKNGNALKNAFVEREPHKDDDWIVLDYDGPDASASPFRRKSQMDDCCVRRTRRPSLAVCCRCCVIPQYSAGSFSSSASVYTGPSLHT